MGFEQVGTSRPSVAGTAMLGARRVATMARHPRMARSLLGVHRQRRAVAGAATPMPARARTLAYHSLEFPGFGVNDCTAAGFRAQLERAAALGYRFVSSAELAEADPAERLLAVTFDDGLRSVVCWGAPVLAEMDIPWTMFVTTDWADGDGWCDDLLTWDEVRDLAAAGVTIGSHSAAHPDFALLDPAAAADDINRSAQRFLEELGEVPADFAIPLGTSRNWTPAAHDAALAAGHVRIWAQSEDLRSPGTLPRSFVAAHDTVAMFTALLEGAYDDWEEPAVD